MHGFPADLDLDILIGSTLDHIGFGISNVYLNFSTGFTVADYANIDIDVESKLRVAQNKQEIAVWNEDWSSIDFQKLLSKAVEGYKVIDKELLVIKFVNGFELELYDNSTQYESVRIRFGATREEIVI